MADESCEDDEWEEEECLILVELVGVIDFDEITSCDPNKCKVLGLETERPLLQLDRCMFTGEYKESVGTIMLLEESQGDPDSEISRKLKYSGKTFKKLLMKRAFLSDKSDTPSGSQLSQGSLPDPGPNVEEEVFQVGSVAQGTIVEKAGESITDLSADFTRSSLTDITLVESSEELTDMVKRPKIDNPNKEPP